MIATIRLRQLARSVAPIVGHGVTDFRPALGFGNFARQQRDEQRRHNADRIHPAPRASERAAEHDPQQRRDDEAAGKCRLQNAGALGAQPLRPHFLQQRGADAPFRADADAGEEARQRQNLPARRQRARAGENAVEHHRADHGPAAPDAIADDAAEHTADGPAEQRDRNQISGDARQRAEFIGGQKLVQRRTDRQQQGIGFIAVEQPEQHRDAEHAPLPARQSSSG